MLVPTGRYAVKNTLRSWLSLPDVKVTFLVTYRAIELPPFGENSDTALTVAPVPGVVFASTIVIVGVFRYPEPG